MSLEWDNRSKDGINGHEKSYDDNRTHNLLVVRSKVVSLN